MQNLSDRFDSQASEIKWWLIARLRTYRIELNPTHVDMAVNLWQTVTVQEAVFDMDDRSLDDMRTGRVCSDLADDDTPVSG